jgi:hypothetical protein
LLTLAALQMDGHLGRFPWARDRSARALPRWSKAQESYGIMQSYYAFGLEEAGDYTRAEDTARGLTWGQAGFGAAARGLRRFPQPPRQYEQRGELTRS